MKRNSSLLLRNGCWLALALACPAGSQAASLLLDFGLTNTLAADALRDASHASGAVTNTEITWNRIAGDTNTLYYGDGTLATGVTLELGRSTAVGPVSDDVINFSDNGFTVNLAGTALTTGVYAGTSPVRDGIFGGTSGQTNWGLGLRLDGLPPGTYRIFVHGRNSNTATISSMLFYGTNGASAGTYAFSTNNATVALANSSPPITIGFVEGDNFGVLTVTIAAGQSLYLACEGTTPAELRGFMNAITIIPGAPNLPAKITAHPAGRTALETASTTFVADGWGSPPAFKQWRLNTTNVLTDGPNISGANSNSLTLRNITPAMAGNYTLFVSNALGSEVSSNALLVVTPVLNTAQMTNIWNLLPGDRPYISTANTERGIAFNTTTTNLLLVSRTPSNQVVVLNALTGAEKHFLDLSGVVDGTFALNLVGVGDDGVVYGANLTTSATSPQYKVYRWANDSPGNGPVPVFIGDPGIGVQANLRWGDNFAVRGAGSTAQILIAPGGGTITSTNVVLLRTISGSDFQTEIPPAVIAVSGVPVTFAALGIAFGPGTNTFWAKTGGGLLYLIQFDLTSKTGSVLQSYPLTAVPGSVRGIRADPSQKFLAGVAVEAPNDNVRLYDVSNLAAGPLLRDQEAFATQNANANATAATTFGANYLFALDSNNGIKAFAINTNYVPPSVAITANPTDRTVMEGATVVFAGGATSTQPLVYQWRFNGTNLSNSANISGANTNTLILANVTSTQAGGYSLFVSNAFGTANSSTGILTVLPTFNTGQMSNIWNLQPGERTYIGTNTSTERGLAFNSATTNLLLVSRLSPDPTVVVLDAKTGAEKNFLDVTGVPGTTPGVSLGLNTIGVADDGVVFGAGVTVSATSPPFEIYRWANDGPGNPPVKVFSGDPAAAVQPNLGYADAIAVRGAGPETQILVAPRGGTNVIILRSSSGLDFQTEIPPAVIAVTGVPSAFAQLGIAFGPGTNTLWGKNVNNQLYLVQFDLASNTGAVLYAYPTNAVPLNLRAISADKNQKFLAGIATDAAVNVQLFDISNLAAGPVLRDQEVFATQNANVTVGGTGATAFGGNYLFALDSNNGIKAFLINTNFVPSPPSFSITSVAQRGTDVVFTWQSVAGRTYQVQFKNSISSANWSNLGNTITASGVTTSFTNTTLDTSSKFYRIQSQ